MSDVAHIEFIADGTSDSGKTNRWDVRSTHDGSLLALVRWYGPWRRYVVYPQAGALFDASCLRSITQFLETEMEVRRG